MINFTLLEVRQEHGIYVFYYEGNPLVNVRVYLRNPDLISSIKTAIKETNTSDDYPKVRSLALAQMKKLLPADSDLRPEELLAYEVNACPALESLSVQAPLEYCQLLDFAQETALQRFVKELTKLVKEDVQRTLDNYISEAYDIIEQNEHHLFTVFQQRSEKTINELKTTLQEDKTISPESWNIIYHHVLENLQYAFALGYAYVRWDSRESE